MTLPFDALAQPNRQRILEVLVSGERSVGDLVAALGLPQPAVSKHLRVMRTAGLVDVRGDAQRRLYRIRPEAFQAIDAWLLPYRAMWARHLEDLERHLDEMADQPDPPAQVRRPRHPQSEEQP